MSILVIVLRTVSLLAFAGPMLLGVSGRHGEPETRASQERGGRAPVVANLSAFGLFIPSLLIFSGGSETSMALPLALSGCLLALGGAALVLRSRAQLGPAWSFEPKADQGTGLVTTGPIATFATRSTWASHFSPWAKRSPSAAGLPSSSLCPGLSRPSPGAPARRRNCSVAHLASATPSTDSERR
jgi:hypothetical protein